MAGTSVGFRYVQTRVDDTLQRIAARELGDASQWVNIALLNGLMPPYLTSSPAQVSATVALAGSQLKVPAPLSQVPPTASPGSYFGCDVSSSGGFLRGDGSGDLAVVSGEANLRQALSNRVSVEKGQLLYHLEYGCLVDQIRGARNTPTADHLAAFYVRSAILEDPRVSAVPTCLAAGVGDAIVAAAVVVPIEGQPINLTVGV